MQLTDVLASLGDAMPFLGCFKVLCLASLQQYDAALAQLSCVATARPQHPFVMSQRAYLYYLKKGQRVLTALVGMTRAFRLQIKYSTL